MTGPLGEGGQTITMETLSLPSPPPPHLSECGAGRGEVGVLKTEQRWQLSLQSWWDEVISLSCCNWWALGWSNFTFFFKCLQRGLSQQGLNSYPKLSFPSKLIYFTDRLAHLAFYTSEIKKKRGAQLVSWKIDLQGCHDPANPWFYSHLKSSLDLDLDIWKQKKSHLVAEGCFTKNGSPAKSGLKEEYVWPLCWNSYLS